MNDLVTSEALMREHTFQLAGPAVANDAIRFLEDEKTQHMQTARAILFDVPSPLTAGLLFMVTRDDGHFVNGLGNVFEAKAETLQRIYHPQHAFCARAVALWTQE
ncbi:hypothetical protein J2802_005538 [Paraburkholderia caribensis]|nr:hypothetical protein [Paraburkholderia caribensis]